jgi:Tfp pilus assembly protein PilV
VNGPGPRGTAGLTLIEILVAFTLLAVGAAALSAWQLSALKVAMAAKKQQQLNALVDAELRYRTLVPSHEPHCLTLSDAQFSAQSGAAFPTAQLSCRVTVEACQLDAFALLCQPASGAVPGIQRVTVQAAFEGEAAPALELSSLSARLPVP